jgi:hypothetical protein
MNPSTTPPPTLPTPTTCATSFLPTPAATALPLDNNTIPVPVLPATDIPPLSYRRPSQLSSAWQTIFQTRLSPPAASINQAGFPIREIQPPIEQPQNEPCGSTFDKDYTGLRIWWNNANTLLQQDDFAELHELCLTLTEYNVGIIALQEVNLNLNRPAIRTAIENVFNEHFGTCKLVLSTSPCHSPTAWKPGGTLLVVLGTWSHAVTTTGHDELGRWCRATLAGRDGSLITVYSAYNVVKGSIAQAGPSTVFAQQWQVLRATGIKDPNPRSQFIKDLRQELDATSQMGSEIVLLGDFNEDFGSDPDLMASVCAHSDLYDVLADRYPDQIDTPTYIRGRHRLDYAFISHTLRDQVDGMGHNQYHQFYYSDHRAGFLDLADHASLRLSSPIAPNARRHIHSNSPLVAKFVTAVHKHLVATGTFHKFANFLLDVDSDDKPYLTVNQIDSQVTFSLLHGNRICSKPPTHPWSEKLHHASLRVRYWKTHLSNLCNKLELPTDISSIPELIGPMPSGPHTKADATRHLSRATQQLRQARKGAVANRAAFLDE